MRPLASWEFRSGFAAAEALSALLKDVTPKAGGGRERERNHSHHVGTQARYVF